MFGMLLTPPGFKEGKYSGDRFEIRVSLNRQPPTVAPDKHSRAAHALDTTNASYSASDRVKYAEDLAKLAEFRKLWKTPGIQEKCVAFAKNTIAQVIAAGDIAGWSKVFRYKLPLPSQDEIIKGLLMGYKQHGHEQITAYINGAKRLGYKIPDDVLSAVKKSVTHAKHGAKRDALVQAVEDAKYRVEYEKKRLAAAHDALEAHEAEQND